MNKRLKSYFFLMISTLTWGAFLPIVKLGFNDSEITPFRYLFYRFLLAGLLSIPIVIHYLKKIKNKWKTIRTILLLELIETSLALSCLYIGLSMTSALDTNLIATSLPLFIIFGGVIFLKEKQTHREWLGLIFALFGTAVIALEPLWTGGERITGSLGGNLLIIAHNILTAIYFLLAKKRYHKIPKLFVSSISFYVGLITFALLSLVEVNFNFGLLSNSMAKELSSPLILGVISYAAVFGSIIGLTTYIKGQDGIEASEASLFNYLQPAIYIPLGYFLLKESASFLQVFSLLIIIFGVYIASRKKK
jgi:drug/metabolite transporter (DMT)-like permease